MRWVAGAALLLLMPLTVAEETPASLEDCEIFARANDNYRCFGEIAGRTGEWDEAADRLERLARIEAENPLIFWALGFVRETRGDLSRAEAAYLRAADLFAEQASPQEVSLSLYLFNLLLKQGRSEEALALVERATRAAEQTGDPLLMAHAAVSSASAAASLHRHDEAERRLLDVQDWVESAAPTWLLLQWMQALGSVYWNQGRLEDSRKIYTRSADLNRNEGNQFAEAHDLYALALAAFADEDDVRRDRFQAALGLPGAPGIASPRRPR